MNVAAPPAAPSGLRTPVVSDGGLLTQTCDDCSHYEKPGAKYVIQSRYLP